MQISLRWYLYPILIIVCILTSWQGVCAYPDSSQNDTASGSTVAIIQPATTFVAEESTGISETVDPISYESGYYHAVTETADDFLAESVTPFVSLSERIVEIKVLSVASGNDPVIVAVLDTGIDKDHEDLNGVVIAEVNFTDSTTPDDVYGHGTHVTGIIAATNDNDIGIDGIVPDCRLLNVKVADDRGRCRMTSLVQGIYWAVDHSALVINISIEMQEPSSLLQQAIDYAWANGAIVIAAAGNGGCSVPVYPAGYDNCVAVTAVKDNGELAPLANYGDWVNAAAPGYKIYSTLPCDEYGSKYGTSFAAAYVSGLSALLFPLMEDTNGNGRVNDEVRQAIDSICGSCIVNGLTK